MRSLAAYSPALKVARAMRDPGMGSPSGADGERHSGQTPDAGRRALCIYCRTDRFVYWLSAIRLSLGRVFEVANGRGLPRLDIAPLNGLTYRGVQPDHANGSRAERYRAARASTTRFSTGWHATSLTAPFTAPHRVTAPHRADAGNRCARRSGPCGTAQLGPITTRSYHDVPDTRCSVRSDRKTRTGRPPGTADPRSPARQPAIGSKIGRATGPAEAIPGQAEDRERIALGLNDVVVRLLLTAGQDLQAALGLIG